jgi:hypothetical protein
VFDRSALRAEAIGRCWSRGRLLAVAGRLLVSCQADPSMTR